MIHRILYLFPSSFLNVTLYFSDKVPPSITKQPEEFTYIQKEQKLELPCMASGNPQPT